jgi:hypothetical protein
MRAALFAVCLVWLAGPAGAQPEPTVGEPAETPQELAKQADTVTRYLVEVQAWRKHAATGEETEAKKKRIRNAEIHFRSQRDLLTEILGRLQLWAYLADRLDRDHPKLTNAEVGRLRQRQFDAISTFRDVEYASPAAAKR